MVIVTHELEFARRVADQVVMMDKGKIVEEADPSEFFRSPKHPKTRQFLAHMA